MICLHTNLSAILTNHIQGTENKNNDVIAAIKGLVGKYLLDYETSQKNKESVLLQLVVSTRKNHEC